MDAEPGYDMTNLQALRRDLERLNESAYDSGLIAVRDGWPEAPARAGRAKRAAPDSTGDDVSTTDVYTELVPTDAEKGKAGATRMLTMLRRVAGDTSPSVPGTDFTEDGVVRLLAHLRKRGGRRFPFLHRLHRFLTGPVSMGVRTSAGVSVERLQRASRQLLEIEERGLDHFQSVRAARRGKQQAPTPLASPAVPDAPASSAAPRKKSSRKKVAVEAP